MTDPPASAFDAVVLAGGAARRLGGRDKMLEVVGGVRMLDAALAAVAEARRVVAVGEPRPATSAVWVREQPAGGGPVAALAAGLGRVEAGLVVLLAADLPFVSRAHVHALVDAVTASPVAGALFVDPDGRDQPLASAWRTAELRAVLPADPAHAGLNRVLLPLTAAGSVIRLPAGQDLLDCDTEQELTTARRRADGGEQQL